MLLLRNITARCCRRVWARRRSTVYSRRDHGGAHGRKTATAGIAARIAAAVAALPRTRLRPQMFDALSRQSQLRVGSLKMA